MPEAKIAQAVQLLDLMLEHFADDGHWTRGRYDDGNGRHCLVEPLPAACRSGIRSARNGIPAKAACPFSDENLVT
jgi:hypothetical protein